MGFEPILRFQCYFTLRVLSITLYHSRFHRHLGSLYTDFTLPPGGPYSLQYLHCQLIFISKRLMSYFPLLSNPVKPVYGRFVFYVLQGTPHRPTTLVIAQSTKWTWRDSNPRPTAYPGTR